MSAESVEEEAGSHVGDEKSAVFFGHADGALTDISYVGNAHIRNPYSYEAFLRTLNVHLLLYERLVVPDDFFLFNPYLRALTLDDYDNPLPHARFLRDGSIVPARRSNAGSSFVQFEQYAREINSYGAPAPGILRQWVEYLDDVLPDRSVTFDEQELRTTIMELTEACLSDAAFLESTKLKTLAQDVVRGIRRHGADHLTSGAGARSGFYHLADEVARQSVARADKLRRLSSAALNVAFSRILDLDPSYPLPIGYLATSLEGLDRRSHRLEPETRFNEAFESSLAVGAPEIARISPEQIADIRGGKAFKRFTAQLRTAREDPRDTGQAHLQQALNEYMADIHDELALDITGLRRKHRRCRAATAWISGGNIAGGLGLGGVGLIVPLATGPSAAIVVVGIVWGLLGAAAPAVAERRAHKLHSRARERLLEQSARQRLLQVSGLALQVDKPER